jgi:thiamine-phosphate pyrophosphorylase
MIDFRLYMITDRKRCAPRSLQTVVREACDAGVRAVQLREKDLSAEALEKQIKRLLEITGKRKARLVVNRDASLEASEDIFLAASTGADGFHFPDGSNFPHELRRKFPRLLVGVSTHSPAAAITAATEGADFVTFGPVFETASKKRYGEPQGLDALARVCSSAGIPVFAVGGVTPDNAADCVAAGAHGVACIGALMDMPDVASAVAAFKNALGSL